MRDNINKKFGNLRTEMKDGMPYFAAADVTRSLKFADQKAAVTTYCKGCKTFETLTPQGLRGFMFVPVEDFCRLVVMSKSADKMAYSAWVFESVLPEMIGAAREVDEMRKALCDKGFEEQKDELSVFANKLFGNLRGVVVDGEPWFVARDVAVALGYNDVKQAIRTHVHPDDKMGVSKLHSRYRADDEMGVSKSHPHPAVEEETRVPNWDTNGGEEQELVDENGWQNKFPLVVDSAGRKQQVVWINESGLYSLIMSSKLKTAKDFQRWVTHDVLPSIRKHGVYATDELLADKEALNAALYDLRKERQLHEATKQQLLEAQNEISLAKEKRKQTNAKIKESAKKTREAETLTTRKMLVALMRRVANGAFNKSYKRGANAFYKCLKLNAGIDVYARRDEWCKDHATCKPPNVMDFIREDEGSTCLAAITNYFGREHGLTFDDIAKKYVAPLDKAA